MYTPPTRTDIEAQIITAIETRTGQTVPLLARAFSRFLAAAIAGALWLLYQVVLWAVKQIFPATADAEALGYLADWYELPRGASVAAVLTLTISGDTGTVIPAGTLWTAGGIVYTQLTEQTIAGGTATADAQALETGVDTTQLVGAALTLPSPLAGVSGAVVAAVVTEGADEESLDDWRARLTARMRTQPQGGAIGDYILWACEVLGIVTAHAVRTGTDIYVYPLQDTTGSARVPGVAKLAEVQLYLQDPERRPLCATVYALAAVPRTATVTITSVTPNDAATKARITTAWQDYCYSRYPLQFLDDPSPANVFSLADVWALVVASGALSTGVTLGLSGIGSGVTSYTVPVGEIIEPGVITWA